MLAEGDRVIVALSGGADSVALFNSVLELKEELLLTVYAAHVNHNLRGAESDGDESFVRSLCESRGVELFVKSADIKSIAEERKIGTELCGREIRYEFFAQLSGTLDAKVATAHTASDNAETLIFNIARGAGLNGLSGIKPVRGNIIRPLIYVTRAEVEAYCAENALSFVTDSSNLTDDYTRNKIRHILLPAFKELNPDFEHTASRETALFSKINSYLELKSDEAIASAKVKNGYDCRGLSELSDGLREEVLYLMCSQNGAEPDYKHIGLLDTALTNGGAVNFRNGVRAVCKQNILRFVSNIDIEDFSDIELKQGLVFTYNGKEYSVKELKHKDKHIVFRTRREGDRFTLPHRRVTKSLKKLFNELKIPDESRSSLILAAEGNKVLWIEGVGCAEGVAEWLKINVK